MSCQHDELTAVNDTGPACVLADSEQQTRRAELRSGLLRRVLEVEETADGYILSFATDPDPTVELEAFISYESTCCSFMRCTLENDQQRNRIHLRVTGPDGTKDFLARWITEGREPPPQESAPLLRATRE